MLVTIYDGNTSTILTSYVGVTTATINSNGSVSVTRKLTSPEGQAMFTIVPNENRVVIERAYNE